MRDDIDLDDAPIGAIAEIPGFWQWIRMPHERGVDGHPWFAVFRATAPADRTVWFSTGYLRRSGARITHVPAPVDALAALRRVELDAPATAAERAVVARLGSLAAGQLTDQQIIAAAARHTIGGTNA